MHSSDDTKAKPRVWWVMKHHMIGPEEVTGITGLACLPHITPKPDTLLYKVVDKQAYDKAVAALKLIINPESNPTIVAEATLRELGEL